MFFIDYLVEHNRYLNLVGIGVIILISYMVSNNKAKVRGRQIVNALILQACLAFVALKTGFGQIILQHFSNLVAKLYAYADEGSHFVFGALAENREPWNFIFAFKVLPIIVFFGALVSVLFHWGIVQKMVKSVSFVLRPFLGITGAESVCAIANSFLGQTESPLLIRHYLRWLSDSELFVVMVSGMATISGSILAVYAAIARVHGYDIAGNLLTASVMAIPASIVIAKIMIPESDDAKKIVADINPEKITTRNALDAISQGTSDGLQLAINVGAMLVAFIALIALADGLLGFFCYAINMMLGVVTSMQLPILTLNKVFGLVFAPFGFFLGFSGDEIYKAGSLIGIKLVGNEMLAYLDLFSMSLSSRAVALMSIALCGFANFSSIGIQLGGIGALVPEKRAALSALGFKAVIAGTLASLLSAMMAGLFL